MIPFFSEARFFKYRIKQLDKKGHNSCETDTILLCSCQTATELVICIHNSHLYVRSSELEIILIMINKTTLIRTNIYEVCIKFQGLF